MSKTLELGVMFILIMKETNPHDELKGSNPSPGSF